MVIIQDIRIYRCVVENITGVNPESFFNKELCAVARRICMKLREKEFSMGEFHHLYINLTTCLAGVAYSEKEDEYLSHDSFKYHIKEGYKEVAHINTVGKKFDKWYDLIWFQKKI